tara:strand:+ start:52 stop:636 length:585 start_codon:yes stop_codon:yes gene_type:complete
MADNFWSGLNRGIGGAIDWATNNKWDLDGLSPGQGWNAPAAGESDGFSFSDAMDAFTKGYSATMGPGGATAAGKSWLDNSYLAGRGATPTSSSPVSTSSAFTAGGKTHTMPGIIIDEPVDFYAFKDNVQYPQQGSSGGSKSNKALDLFKTGLNVVSLLGCDIRIKEDIAPLITTEVNDDLAQAAFFVKELRECS